MTHSFDVVVAGGGVVGLTAALAMGSRGFKVAVIDKNSITTQLTDLDPRVYAVNQASCDLFQHLGVWQQLNNSRLSPYRHMEVWDAASGGYIKFNSTVIATDNLGFIIEEAVLKQAILQGLSLQKSVTLFENHTIGAIEPAAHSIQVSNEDHSWEATLLMMADGANSLCRQLLNVPLVHWPYHQHAIVATVSTEKPHQQTAYQIFNPDGPLAFLPLTDKNQCSIVWSTTPTRAKHLVTLSDEQFNQELTHAFAKRLGQAKVLSKRYQFPLLMRHVKQYVGSHWLVLGDAAHTIHPLAGLGLNVGLADIATWLTCLDRGKTCLTSTKVLHRYQRERKYAVWQIIAMMEGLKALFSNPLPPVITLRGFGLRACNAFTPLKRLFIEQATGRGAIESVK